jgi:hypothetical protein
MYLNTFFWEGAPRFHQTLKWVHGTKKKLRTPDVKQINLVECRSRDDRQIKSILPSVPVFYFYFHEALKILNSILHHQLQFWPEIRFACYKPDRLATAYSDITRASKFP